MDHIRVAILGRILALLLAARVQHVLEVHGVTERP